MSTPPFESVLVANRGEIAVRIMRTARALGMRTIAVHSDVDAGARHVREADEAVSLGGATSAESYLRIERIMEAAKATGAACLHPGYGFLSERAPLAEACAEAGVTFVGPSADAIRAMGDKIVAKRTMLEAGVPCVPGWTGDEDASLEDIAAAAEEVGYPVMIKAAAGGGGKGMRVVSSPKDLAGADEAARREAGSAFGDARVFLERFVARSRHIEFQVLGDAHGNLVHLFERECSIQRRHQKIVEESPSPGLDDALRARMGEAAVRAAKAIDYVNAGTVELMLGADGEFYFLEVNTRLQVEHPVTELVTGHDLVELQLRVAAGEPLPFAQDDLRQRGHAIECRVYAEDAARDFMPSTGRLAVFDPPTGPGVRVDAGIAAGDEVTVHYDPMLAKLITVGADREQARRRMVGALRETAILGVTTNVPFLAALLEQDAFVAGDLHTGYLDEHPVDVPGADGDAAVPDEVLLAAALCREGRIGGDDAGGGGRASAADDGAPAAIPGPFAAAGAWRNV